MSGAGSSSGASGAKTGPPSASSSSGGSRSGSPGPADKDRLIKEFVLITATDSKCATFFLENHGWKLQEAVPDYFNLAGSIMNDNEELKDAVKNEEWARRSSTAAEVVSAFTFMSWNVDGLDDRNFDARTRNLINILKKEKADIVFLQEVVQHSMTQLMLGLPEYHCVVQGEGMELYFTATLLKKDTVKYLTHRDEPFENSSMGRGVLSIEAQLGDMKLWLHNMHLESTAEFREQRVEQLKSVFAKLTKSASTHSIIAAGDLNLRDAEVGLAGGIPSGAVDLWESCGRRQECQYTWDTVRNSNCLSKGGGGGYGNYKPRLRFDRAYLQPCTTRSQSVPVPKHFSLVGVEKVPGLQGYTSDHWALQVYFTVNKN